MHWWVGLLVAAHLWKLDSHLLVLGILVFKDEAFMSVLAHESLGSLSEVRGVFNNLDLPPTSED